jgi:hypothetical protein
MRSISFFLLTAALTAVGSVGFAQSPPVAVTGGNVGNSYVVDCNNVFAPGSAITNVQLDGTGSFDPDGTPVSFWWFEECPFGNFVDPFSPTPVYQIDMTGVCSRTCVVELRVISGGETTKKGFMVTVADVTDPVVTCPIDVVGIWGDDTTPTGTGMATAVDNCDPAPVVSFTDVIIPQAGPGTPEQIIQRTWTATDCTGRQSACLQTITLLSPSGGPDGFANLDFDPTGCPNLFAPTAKGTVDVLLLSSANFKAIDVVKSSVRLSLRVNPSVAIKPAGFATKDFGSISALEYGDCNSALLDGLKDMRLRFSRASLSTQLGLNRLSAGETVEVVITGKLKSGKLFATRDQLTIQ